MIRHCPKCGGSGKNCDARLTLAPGQCPDAPYQIRPATDCTLCLGHGLVHIFPLTETEAGICPPPTGVVLQKSETSSG